MMNTYLVFKTSIALALGLIVSPAIGQTQPTADAAITLGGDEFPSATTVDYRAVCRGKVVRVYLQYDHNKKAVIRVFKTGIELTNRSDLVELKNVVSNLSVPYISGVTCSGSAVSFGIAGRPLTGDISSYRLNLPLAD